ncbi:hypothetical protein MTO96_024895 [Rhipicephalus appendiculatus]
MHSRWHLTPVHTAPVFAASARSLLERHRLGGTRTVSLPECISWLNRITGDEDGIKHTRTPPWHAASNGAAEKLVRTTKTVFLKQVLADDAAGLKRTMQERLCHFLLSYRNTPNSVTAKTPAELFLKCSPRVKLSLLVPSFADNMLQRQREKAERRNYRRGSTEYFSVGEKMFVKTVRGEVESWQKGLVEQVVSPPTYLVKIGNSVRFTHLDHLRKRWTSAAIYRHPQSQGTEACDNITVREPSHSEPSSERNNVISRSGLNEGASRGVFRDEHHVQGHDEVDEDEDVPDPRTTKATASTSVNALCTAPPLRRSDRTRRPPDRFQSGDIKKSST